MDLLLQVEDNGLESLLDVVCLCLSLLLVLSLLNEGESALFKEHVQRNDWLVFSLQQFECPIFNFNGVLLEYLHKLFLFYLLLLCLCSFFFRGLSSCQVRSFLTFSWELGLVFLLFEEGFFFRLCEYLLLFYLFFGATWDLHLEDVEMLHGSNYSDQFLVEYFDFFFDGLVLPQFIEMAFLNIHESSQLAVGFSCLLHMLDHIHLEVGMLEQVVLYLSDHNHQDKVKGKGLVSLVKTDALSQNYVDSENWVCTIVFDSIVVCSHDCSTLVFADILVGGG